MQELSGEGKELFDGGAAEADVRLWLQPRVINFSIFLAFQSFSVRYLERGGGTQQMPQR